MSGFSSGIPLDGSIIVTDFFRIGDPERFIDEAI
jgi:hypothetical protein